MKNKEGLNKFEEINILKEMTINKEMSNLSLILNIKINLLKKFLIFGFQNTKEKWFKMN